MNVTRQTSAHANDGITHNNSTMSQQQVLGRDRHVVVARASRVKMPKHTCRQEMPRKGRSQQMFWAGRTVWVGIWEEEKWLGHSPVHREGNAQLRCACSQQKTAHTCVQVRREREEQAWEAMVQGNKRVMATVTAHRPQPAQAYTMPPVRKRTMGRPAACKLTKHQCAQS